jgi:hypothetical protein
VQAINLIAGFGAELLVKRFQELMIYLLRCAACPANQVMVIVTGDFIHQLPIANMGCQDKALFRQKAESAIHRRFGHGGQNALSLPEDFLRREMTAGVLQDLQDEQPLRGHAKASLVQRFNNLIEH